MTTELFYLPLFKDPALVAYWRFEGNSSDAKDSHSGIDTSVTYNSSNGKFNQGAGFNGSSSLISVTDHNDFHLVSKYSVNMWIKTTETTNGLNFFQSWSSLNFFNAGFRFFTTGDGVHTRLSWQQAKNTGSNSDVTGVSGNVVINDNIWHMATFVWDGTNLNIYVDGVIDVSSPAAYNAAYGASGGANYVRIGDGNNNGTEAAFYNGAMDDLAVFNRALTATEISQIYKGSIFQGGMI